MRFSALDLAAGPEAALSEAPHLVTAAALFDLVSEAWIAALARAVAAAGAVFYTALTYDGAEEWTPPHPADAAIHAAFLAHQGGDKGFGPSLGPAATAALARAFQAHGYAVETATSPWRLGPGEAALLHQLAEGTARAAAETGRVGSRRGARPGGAGRGGDRTGSSGPPPGPSERIEQRDRGAVLGWGSDRACGAPERIGRGETARPTVLPDGRGETSSSLSRTASHHSGSTPSLFTSSITA